MQPKLYKSMFLHRVCCISVSCMTATTLGGWVGGWERKIRQERVLDVGLKPLPAVGRPVLNCKNCLGPPPWCTS